MDLPLWVQAIEERNVQMLKESVTNINELFTFYFALWSPLQFACSQGDAVGCAYLLEMGADPNLGDRMGRYPLYLAACGSNLECVQFLLAHGAVVDAKDWFGCTALGCAIKYGNKVAVRLLLDAGARIDNTGYDSPRWALALDKGRRHCRYTSLLFIGLRKFRTTLLSSNAVDVTKLIAAQIWTTRMQDVWHNYSSKAFK